MTKPPTTQRVRVFTLVVDLVMSALALVFAVLLVMQFTMNLSPVAERRASLGITLIWIVFVIDFCVRLALADSKREFLRHNWISAIALVVPALRVLRVLQLARAVQAAQAMQISGVVSGGKRADEALRRSLGLHPTLYISLMTLLVTALAAAGMYAIEHTHGRANITNVGDAVWWTTATLTTVGSELYPVTAEGRVLAILVMVYGLIFAGYIAATLTSALLTRRDGQPASDTDEMTTLRDEMRALRRHLRFGSSHEPQQEATGD
ncbi:MAG: ion transporter, partial [Dehalococcoidia bacterium]